MYDNEYDLFLAPDINDRSDGGNLCQWFFFAVAGIEPGVAYKFNIVNFKKKTSLFGSGKQPLVCRGQAPRPPTTSFASSVPSLNPRLRSSMSRAGTLQQLDPQAQQRVSTSAGEYARQASSSTAAGEYARQASSALPSARTSSSGCSGEDPPVSQSQAAGWVRAGHSIAYYPSPYRGRTLADIDPSRRGKKVRESMNVCASSRAIDYRY